MMKIMIDNEYILIEKFILVFGLGDLKMLIFKIY